ncbi:MAG: di-trans,poly-cis-decaprenylcistransferase [Candidatus Levybacteria bacterium]|nr:di-trans,poly-cis-decaprenylcistransferase [Candidatus Levybacteria bacterium]
MNKQIPEHVGIIMDGNRRWAKKRRLPLFAGHNEGAKRIEPLVAYAAKQGISYLTLWAFSTENWERGDKEVRTLLAVFRRVLKDPMLDRLQKDGVRVNVIGDLSPFPRDITEGVKRIIQSSKNNKRITATFALNYGGRAEILRAVKQVTSHKSQVTSEKEFAQYLYTAGMPDPDMIIRTGGETRLSGFLAWQSVYSELYFTETLWPDFDEKAFQKALDEYARRERRFGK